MDWLVRFLVITVSMTSFSDAVTFSYIGSYQEYTVPSGVYSITIEAYGAAGGTPSSHAASAGGKGAYISTEVSVTPSEILYVYVGERGKATSAGWNGGGIGGLLSGTGSRGGGASDIRRTIGNLDSRVVVAAGGGGEIMPVALTDLAVTAPVPLAASVLEAVLETMAVRVVVVARRQLVVLLVCIPLLLATLERKELEATLTVVRVAEAAAATSGAAVVVPPLAVGAPATPQEAE